MQRRLDALAARRAARAARASDARSCVRSRGRALRSATRARMRSTSPMRAQRLAQAFEAARVDQQRERLVAAAQLLLIGERAIEPAAQLPRAHRRDAVDRAARTASPSPVPDSDTSISRLRRVAASRCSASPRSSTRERA